MDLICSILLGYASMGVVCSCLQMVKTEDDEFAQALAMSAEDVPQPQAAPAETSNAAPEACSISSIWSG